MGLNIKGQGAQRVPGTNNTVKRYSRGGFVLDPSVRRVKRPVAGRLMFWH